MHGHPVIADEYIKEEPTDITITKPNSKSDSCARIKIFASDPLLIRHAMGHSDNQDLKFIRNLFLSPPVPLIHKPDKGCHL